MAVLAINPAASGFHVATFVGSPHETENNSAAVLLDQGRLEMPRSPAPINGAFVAKNFPVLGSIISSYEDQIRSAFARQDIVSLNHRTTAWLASYFDILFAANRQYHPGEKRLLARAAQLPSLPANMADDLPEACLRACSLEKCVADHLQATRERLARWLKTQGVSVT